MAVVDKISQAMVKKPAVPAVGNAVTWERHSDGGFGIRLASSGRVSFLARYWSRSRKKEQWKTLGTHPDLTLTKARKEASKILLAARSGQDPVEEARAAEIERRATEAQTVAVLAEEWLEALPRRTTRRGRRISPRTVEMYSGCMRNYILRQLGNRPVTQVTRRDVAALLATATRGGPYMGNRVVSVLSIFYSHLEAIEAVPPGFNPARRPPRNPEQRRGEHASVRLSHDQEARLAREIFNAMESDPVGATALLVLLDTGRRLREVLAHV